MFLTTWKNRSLILELTKRDFSQRYRGSYGGLTWSFAQPIFLLAVYTLVFSVILKTRWGLSGETKDFALILFAGLIVLNTFSECLNKAPVLITDNPNFVKKVVFPSTLVRESATIGANATIVCGITIGKYAFIGAGAVVTKDAPDHAMIYGNPATQHGWVCECGNKLDQKHYCSTCQKKWDFS